MAVFLKSFQRHMVEMAQNENGSKDVFMGMGTFSCSLIEPPT